MCFTSTKWWQNKYIRLLFLITLPLSQGYTQILQRERFEIPLGKNEKTFEVIPAQNHALFLFRRLEGTGDDRIDILKLDTVFKAQWRGYLPVNRKFTLMGKRAEKDQLYLLFRYQDYSRKDFELFSIRQENGSFLKYSVPNLIPFVPTEFQITPQAAIIGGYFNQIPVVIYFSFHTQKTKIVPGLFNESGELTQIKTYADGSFDILISARNFKGQQTIWIKNYDPEGILLRNLSLETEENKHLIFARSVKTTNNMQLVAGVYGGRHSEYSKGLFMASIDPSGYQQIKYYSYGDLENFFKYLKARREQRVKERIERRKVRGKKIRFNYRFLVHEIVPYKDQYILLGEAFYPRYITIDRTYHSGFFNPMTFSQNSFIRDGRIFDGYRYTHAVVMGFDHHGKLMWDNSFEINDVKTFTLEQFVKLEIQQDKIALLYLFENQLRTKIIKGNEVLEGKTIEPLKTGVLQEIVKNEAEGPAKLDYWYQHYFFAHGVQEVTSANRNKRRVFFINKIRYAGR